ncbi:hypothetical protein [Enterobacter pseudoroggenkampii]|uniref:hypothetical protein n=1 Tax=Enterobacter pseudoroggenkampii TaxID=2996112 RepID=UPI002263FBA1|nr:hypothetical protein [Enterobacter pseudoroggenkampii]MCX8289085.1 hypothetical protein [Enterobacter pseudoroggenkampii]
MLTIPIKLLHHPELCTKEKTLLMEIIYQAPDNTPIKLKQSYIANTFNFTRVKANHLIRDMVNKNIIINHGQDEKFNGCYFSIHPDFLSTLVS